MRYAIYFTPPANHPLTRAAAEWLGRCAFGQSVEAKHLDSTLVQEPARYGFHGTLKAPFHLKEGTDEAALLDAFDSFVEKTSAFQIDKLVLGQLGPFFALVPGDNCHDGIYALADACVREFEPFRAALSAGDIARRKPETLPEPQRHYLERWGYPYVFEEFRFHMTLTGPVKEDAREGVHDHLVEHFRDFTGKPLAISHLALFAETERGSPFNVLRILPLKAADERKAD